MKTKITGQINSLQKELAGLNPARFIILNKDSFHCQKELKKQKQLNQKRLM